MSDAQRPQAADSGAGWPQPAPAGPEPSPEIPPPGGPADEPTTSVQEPDGDPDSSQPDLDDAEPVVTGAPAGFDLAEAADADTRSRAELLAELMEAEARRDEYLDDLRRARAEFENFRKRTMREGTTQRELGKAAVVERMLDVLDDVDRTLEASSSSDDQTLARGVEMMATKLVQALQTAGLQRIDATDVPFDPSWHEAVQQQPTPEPVEEPTVVAVLRPGYRLGDRVLRAAMVVVQQ